MGLLIFIAFLIALIVLQYVMLSKARKSNNNKYWIIFFSIILSVIISFIAIVILEELMLSIYPGYPDSDARGSNWYLLIYIFFAVITILISIINAIVGIALKISQKHKNIKENKETEKTPNGIRTSLITIIIVLCSYLIIYYLPYVIGVQYIKIAEKNAGEYAIEYLTEKYGDRDFKVVDIDRDYIYNGIISQTLDGFDVEISSNLTPEIIKVNVDGLSKWTFKISSTNLEDVLYEETIN